MLLSALSFLVVAQSSSELPEGLMNNPVIIVYSLGNNHSKNAKVLSRSVFVTDQGCRWSGQR